LAAGSIVALDDALAPLASASRVGSSPEAVM